MKCLNSSQFAKNDMCIASDAIISVSNLTTQFNLPEGRVLAVNGVSLNIYEGETLCIVGESGCGKTVTALSIMRLVPDPPGEIVEGEIVFLGQDLLRMNVNEMRRIRGNKIAMIFQEPMTCLNPLYTIGNQISEVFKTHKKYSQKKAWNASVEILKEVGIPSPENCARQYIHEMSGGMRQRAMIAMALACNPRLLIADEPTTAVDVTIQAQVLRLIEKIQETNATAILLITHNLGLVADMADRVVVMYLGRIMEEAHVDAIFEEPLHPYTKGLIASIPFPGRKSLIGKKALKEIPGVVPSLDETPKGCPFNPRCSMAQEICYNKSPELIDVTNGHRVACWRISR
jgi:oligopeptide/dipeptide ABC transporter ATP-binding protein